MKYKCLLGLVIGCLSFLTSIVWCSEDEERLVRDLFRDYNKLIRPVEAMNQTVVVDFGLSFIQLINVNEKNQIMTSNVWLQLTWMDYQLVWDPADYGGINVLRLPPDKVWKPDIVLFNNADGNYEVRYKSNVLIYPNGGVMWVPPAIYQSSCRIDVTYFPFDQQKCVMKFGSWTFNGDQVSLNLYNDNDWVDLSDYWKSGTWDIVEVPAFLNVYNNSKYGKISFYITIRRKTLFYTVNLILPTVLISFLCILVFYLPAEAGEKVTLGISILLSLVVFLLLVSKILPPTSLVLPLIAKYLLFTFLMNTVSILVTVIIINWNFRGPRTHRWGTCFLMIALYLLLKIPYFYIHVNHVAACNNIESIKTKLVLGIIILILVHPVKRTQISQVVIFPFLFVIVINWNFRGPRTHRWGTCFLMIALYLFLKIPYF
ncbi:unnamed protein product [Larinioides sclopetarius]|uniref:Nicotinic acetylcholine receptor beta 1 subunit n=1 Tax=Larinioides sclopetarius TaxID=280406 RepID=A0AAV2AFV6_9ARAC